MCVCVCRLLPLLPPLPFCCSSSSLPLSPLLAWSLQQLPTSLVRSPIAFQKHTHTHTQHIHSCVNTAIVSVHSAAAAIRWLAVSADCPACLAKCTIHFGWLSRLRERAHSFAASKPSPDFAKMNGDLTSAAASHLANPWARAHTSHSHSYTGKVRK